MKAATLYKDPASNSGISPQSRTFRFASPGARNSARNSSTFLNHANVRLPNNDISSPNFGEISEALPGRLVQLALKFVF